MAQKDKLVNVPRDVADDFYRYKMPVLRGKVEGRGNGIKTVIENCLDIAKALDRNPDYVNKFFGFELGTQVSVQNEKYIVNGRHDPEDLAKVLDVFIEKFVLCSGCRNPETNMNIKGEKIFLNCRACGKTSQCDPTNKLVPYITKRDTGVPKKPKPGPAPNKPTAVVKEDEEDWFLSTTNEAVEERRLQTLGSNDRLSSRSEKPVETPQATDTPIVLAPGQNAVEVLEKYFQNNPSPEEAFSKINALALAQNWSEGTLLRSFLFPALFAKDIRKDFYKKTSYLAPFVKDKKQQKVLLYCVEKLCQIVSSSLNVLPSILNGFYTEEILDEEILIQWYKHPIADPKKFPPKLSKAIRDNSKIFIDWLQTAQVEDDSE